MTITILDRRIIRAISAGVTDGNSSVAVRGMGAWGRRLFGPSASAPRTVSGAFPRRVRAVERAVIVVI